MNAGYETFTNDYTVTIAKDGKYGSYGVFVNEELQYTISGKAAAITKGYNIKHTIEQAKPWLTVTIIG